jgi:4-hydroxy-tetrahydrodipicolinate reductase
MQTMRIGIIGSRGRLGSALVTACKDAGVPVVAELDRDGLVESGRPSVVFDASSAAMFGCTVQLVERWQASLIYCVSVLPAEHRRLLVQLAERVPVLLATNLSPGHWLQTRLIAQLAMQLKQCELACTAAVYERHPTTKRDRPSASALQLSNVWLDSGQPAVTEVVSLRHGPSVSGHRVQVDLAGEALCIGHEVSDLSAAAAGGLLLAGRAHELSAGFVTSDEIFDEVFGGQAR